MTQTELFPVARPTPEQIVASAIEMHKPVATFALFSGGNGSLAATHWAMNNVAGCQVAHINTGIGIERTREFVRQTCAREGWPLTEIRAKEDCGQDYDEIVREHGFPGPAAHGKMYIRLKERPIEELIRRNKRKYSSEKVMLLTGICHDDSQRRSGYGGKEITVNKSQLWVNAMYWRGSTWMHHYVNGVGIPRNPVAEEVGMSAECGCGAFADVGELAIWRAADQTFGARIDRLQKEARLRGVHCDWERRPPRDRDDTVTPDFFSPMCTNCLKSQRLAA